MDDIEIEATVADDVLRLMFTACHPVLAPEARVALTLKMVAGLSTDEIARAFLVPTTTMAARITRAKKALTDAGVPFEVPAGAELESRLASVLEVVYLVVNEGYAATSGPNLTRPVLCDEAMRLGRILAGLAPAQPEAHGLVALIEIQASRLRARVSADGAPVTLLAQNRGQWDRLLITHALAALARAESLLGSSLLGSSLLDPSVLAGPYVLQASIAACHARAAVASDTDWDRIAALYGSLVEVTGSPIVELNRAVAVGMASGPAAGLVVVDELIAEDVPALRSYHLVPAVRADLLARLGRADEARAEFERAATMTANDSERTLLLARAADC